MILSTLLEKNKNIFHKWVLALLKEQQKGTSPCHRKGEVRHILLWIQYWLSEVLWHQDLAKSGSDVLSCLQPFRSGYLECILFPWNCESIPIAGLELSTKPKVFRSGWYLSLVPSLKNDYFSWCFYFLIIPWRLCLLILEIEGRRERDKHRCKRNIDQLPPFTSWRGIIIET